MFNLTGDFIRKIINKLKKKYNTSSHSVLAEYLDITVSIQPLGNVWGIYKYINRNKVIFINSVLSEIERRFVWAHEIGHAVLHPKSLCYFIIKFIKNHLPSHATHHSYNFMNNSG